MYFMLTQCTQYINTESTLSVLGVNMVCPYCKWKESARHKELTGSTLFAHIKRAHPEHSGDFTLTLRQRPVTRRSQPVPTPAKAVTAAPKGKTQWYCPECFENPVPKQLQLCKSCQEKQKK